MMNQPILIPDCTIQQCNTIVIGDFTIPTAYTLYLRRQIHWSQRSVAYKLSLNYRYGIIVFVNGTELMRDNLPQGEIFDTTPAEGGYNDYQERIYLRNCNELPASYFYLSVELHWTLNDMMSGKPMRVLFDAWFAELGNTPNTQCYMIPLRPESMDNATDFSFVTSLQFPPDRALYSRSFPDSYTINTIEFYSLTLSCWMPQEFTLYSVTRNNSIEKLLGVLEPNWRPSEWTRFSTFNLNKDVVSIELHMFSRNSLISISELRFGICQDNEYPIFKYSASRFLVQDYIDLYPSSTIYSNCSSLNTLPAGIQLNYTDCHIYGHYQGASITTELTILAQSPIQSYTTVVLTIESCKFTTLLVKRVYGSPNSFYESLKLINPTTGYVVFQIPSFSTQEQNKAITSYLCTDSSLLRIVMGSEVQKWWDPNSFVEFWLYTSLQNILLLHTRYDERINGDMDHYLSLKIPISSGAQWRYHHTTVVTGWTQTNFDDKDWDYACVNEFPDSSNQLQFYRNSFFLDSLGNFTGFQLYLHHQFCYQIYINGFLAQTYGITGEVTEQSFCEIRMDTVKYRAIVLPVYKYLRLKTNVVSIVIVTPSAQIVQSSFDCIIHMIATDFVSRAASLKQELQNGSSEDGTSLPVQLTQSIENPSFLFDNDLTTGVHISSCDVTEIEIEFSDNRCEFFNQIVLFNDDERSLNGLSVFDLYGRNTVLESWESIISVDSLYWFHSGQSKTIHVTLPHCYHFFRFVNMSGQVPSTCEWSLVEIMFLLLPVELSDYLDYSTSVIPLANPIVPIRPKQCGMSHFYATGLPAGIYMDSASGTIYGSILSAGEAIVNISAWKADHTVITTQLNLSFQRCDLDYYMLLDIHVLVISPPHNFILSIFDKSKQILHTVTQSIENRDEFVYRFCVISQPYIVRLESDRKNTEDRIWIVVNDLILTQGSFSDEGDYSTVVNVTFQAVRKHSIWKMLSTNETPSDWYLDSFDDYLWENTNMEEFQHDTITTYFRRFVTIRKTDLELLIHVQIQYEGGIVAYFGNVKVAHFNLPLNYNSTTYAVSHHDYSKIESFSVNLVQSFVYPGGHVFSLEYHISSEQTLPLDRLSVDIVALRETVTRYRNSMRCEILREGESVVMNWRTPLTPLLFNRESEQTINEEFKTVSVNLPVYPLPNSYLIFTPTNQIPIRPQGIYIVMEESVYVTIVLEGFMDDRWIVIKEFSTSGQEILYPLPQLLLGYSSFRLQLSTCEAYMILHIKEFAFTFNSKATIRCPGLDRYLPAWDNDISAIPCPEGFTGYQYRRCLDGIFQPPILEECILEEPSQLNYPQQTLLLLSPIDEVYMIPTVKGIVNTFSIIPSLPSGLYLDPITGILEGIPMEQIEIQIFTVLAENQNGVTSFFLNLSVEFVQCTGEGDWPTVKYRAVPYSMMCPNNISMFGIRLRQCNIVDRQGIWDEEHYYCYSKTSAVYLLVIGSIALSYTISLSFQIINRYKKRNA